ncbi:MAG TPA: aromatic amino acid lyase, partial [Homoserinimonas sp.]|nr:aromatic amino acid lyase [Homoserinimonas sp.]
QGSPQAYAEAVHAARNHPEQGAIAARMRSLIRPEPAVSMASARIQDPFGLRVVPQVHAPAAAALGRLTTIVETELNAGVENPMVAETGIFHHGQFHLATLAAALDHLRISLVPVFTLSSARLGLLLRADMTGLPPFLAAELPGSSGMMITEYLVQDLLAELRMLATPTTGPAVSISLGMEEHANFAPQGARALRRMVQPSSTAIAVEAVAAVRALRLEPERLGTSPAHAAFDFLARELDSEIADRPLGEDIERAIRLVPLLGGVVGDRL